MMVERKNKKRVLILCEGSTDIAFLYVILKKWLKCVYIEKKYQCDIGLISFEEEHSDDFSWYENGNYYFHACCVGGCDKFVYFFNKHIAKKIEDSNYYSYFIIIRDRDNLSDEEILSPFKKIPLSLKINEWSIQKCKTWSNDEYDLNTFLSVIPTHDEGALENIILDALASEKEIVSSAKEYVDNLKGHQKKYLIKKRDELKAKVGIVFTLMSPQSTFSSFTSKIELIDINNEAILNSYSFLNKFV